MDCAKVGKLITLLRHEKGLTQKAIADALHISNKTVSKWECGLGCPDVSLWADLSRILNADIEGILKGELNENRPDIGKMHKVKFFVCPMCGNVLTATSSASITCCGRKLEALLASEASGEHAFTLQLMDTDYYLAMQHPMIKEHFIAFVAYVSYDSVLIIRLYPEQGAQARLPIVSGNGQIFVYCNKDGLYTCAFSRAFIDKKPLT